MHLGDDALAAAARKRAAVFDEAKQLFDLVLESSKAGVRKPDPRFYQLACEQLDVQPAEVVFLDDLGINLKPARALGMTTIKVVEPETALQQLENLLNLPILKTINPENH
jgi:putative hydrolase of the HAD superfamily